MSVYPTKDHVLSREPRCPASEDAISAVPAGSCSACDDDAGLGSYQGLLECLEGLADPRRKRGMRHRTAVVLGVRGGGGDGLWGSLPVRERKIPKPGGAVSLPIDTSVSSRR